MFSELKRRNVIRAATAYAVVAWLLLQVASILAPTFEAPPWVMQGVTILLIVGFPIAVALSWFFDLTPEGIVRDEEGVKASPSNNGRVIDAAIIGVLLIAVALFSYNEFVVEERERNDLSVRPALAVLPFASVGGDEDAKIFADGLATELIRKLSDWPGMTVVARAASFAEGIDEDLFAAGQKLDARYFVTGDVRRSDHQIYLGVSVIDSTDSSVVWSENYDRDTSDLFALENEISSSIVAQLSPALLEQESERAARADPDNLDAWEAGHRGWWHLNLETAEGYEEAMKWLDQAIELDPNWSWPYSVKVLAMYRSSLVGRLRLDEPIMQEMMQLAEKAVQLDPNEPFAHHAIGHAYGVIGQRDESILAMARGIQLNPNDAMAQGCYGMQLAAAARSDDAIAAADAAMSLSPDDPWMYWFTLVRARAHFAAEDYETSEQWALRSNQIIPTFPAFLHSTSAAAHLGKIDVARERVIAKRNSQGWWPTVEMLEASFLARTDEDYTTRLMEGLRLADFDTAGAEEGE